MSNPENLLENFIKIIENPENLSNKELAKQCSELCLNEQKHIFFRIANLVLNEKPIFEIEDIKNQIKNL